MEINQQTIRVRKAKVSDLIYIIRVIVYSFPFWYLRLPYLFFPTFVAELDNKKAGFVVVLFRKSEGEIALISVDRNFRKKNIGTVLLKEAINYLKKINAFCCTAKVRADNETGLAFFKKSEFRIIKLVERPLLGSVYLTRRDL